LLIKWQTLCWKRGTHDRLQSPLGACLWPAYLQMRQVRRVHEDHQMSYIIASLPPLKCFVRREFLYNHTEGHGELEPAIWVSIKALRGQVFRIESLLPNYGALYDKLPLHAYVWREDNDGRLTCPSTRCSCGTAWATASRS
jgi:hypothetical protein